MKPKIKTSVVICGLLCITALEIFAMSQGIDGKILTAVIGIIALAIGVMVPSTIKLK